MYSKLDASILKDYREELQLSFDESARAVSKGLLDKPMLIPEDLQGFDDRLLEVYEKITDTIFGKDYREISGKISKKVRSTPNFIKTLVDIGNHCKASEVRIINEQLDPYGFFESIIEKNIYLENYEEYLFSDTGIKREVSKIGLGDKHKIVYQAMACILWAMEKDAIPTISAMSLKLLNIKGPLHSLLNIGTIKSPGLPSRRTVENWLRVVF